MGRGVFLGGAFQATGEVRFQRATISPLLDCEGGTFLNENKTSMENRTALDREGVHVNGSVFLRCGFYATGNVSLQGAAIAGDLDCFGGTFHNVGKLALTGEMSTVGGRVFLHRGFQAMGEVRLLGARITGELDCHGGLFYNPKGYALAVDRAHMGGGMFLGKGFLAIGEVRLVDASITGDLHCRGGIFQNPDGFALTADRVDVRGVARLDQGFRTEGEVRLVGAKVAQLDDDEASWPPPKKLFLDGFVYTTIGSDFDDPIKPIDARARLRWLKRQPSPPFRPRPYLQLA